MRSNQQKQISEGGEEELGGTSKGHDERGVMDVFTILMGSWYDHIYICQNKLYTSNLCNLLHVKYSSISKSNKYCVHIGSLLYRFIPFSSKCHFLLLSHFWLMTFIPVSLRR